jgi:two-component system, OmpR family, response regulator
MTKHIMVVDDEETIRNLLTEFFTSNGYRVSALQSPLEAEKAVKGDRPDLIISDLQLEESDGLDMIGRLKANLPDTPVILLTGVLFDPKVVRDLGKKGVSCYIEKTAPLGRILDEVKRLIR